ncbi:MAG: polymer-forming cytoskeletal protein [Sphingomonas phyllosphaerae]|uniref:bactofilin family protein n=1 Tax=Sphingomonas phyllosphaerae TaxID=257003 RepID=UPI002FFBAA29
MSRNATFSMIGADVVITGDISASADLHIDGCVRGDINCAGLVQGSASEMIGTIIAQSAQIAGTVRGSIIVDRLVIQRSAQIVGDVHYETLTVEQGARVEGTFAKGGAELLAAGIPVAPTTAEPSAEAPLLIEASDANEKADR